MKVFCTVFADASWCPHTRASGWAAWIRCGNEVWRGYAPLKAPAPNVPTAEAMAAANAIRAAVKAFNPTHVHIVLDCLYVLERIKDPERRLSDTDREVFAEIARLLHGRRVTCAHVKAHTKGETPRDYVNGWCDRQAKLAMRTGEVSPTLARKEVA